MFESKDSRSQWQIVYDYLQTMNIDDVVTDEVLQGLLPGAPWASVVTAFHRASREMLAENLRAFDRVRTIGYRMVESREQERLALGQHRKAKRRNKAAKALASSVDLGRLTHDERRRLSLIEDHLARQAEMMNRLTQRQLKAEKRIAVTEKELLVNRDRGDELAGRLDRLTEMLERHGITE